MITVKLLDSSATGGTRNVEVSTGTTVSQLISAHTSANPESCMVRVNRASANLETIIPPPEGRGFSFFIPAPRPWEQP